MKKGPTLIALSLLTLFAIAGCSDKEEQPQVTEAEVEAAADAAAKEAAASSQGESDQKVSDCITAGMAEVRADMEAKLDEEKAKLEGELSEQLAQQAATLKQQYAASNRSLRAQVDSLTEKYNAHKDKLPEEITEPFEQKLPQLESSISQLEQLVAQFSPNSLEQLERFKTRYSAELEVARQVGDELLALLGKSSYTELLPKFKKFATDPNL